MRSTLILFASLLLTLPTAVVAAPAQAATSTLALYPESAGFPPALPAVHSATPGERLAGVGRVPAGTTRIVVQRATGPGVWTSAGPAVNTDGRTYWGQLQAPARLGRYRFRTVATGAAGRTVSPAWTLDVVRQRNNLALASGSTRRSVEGAGSITPARPKARLKVQVLRRGAWTDVATVTQDARGRYRFRVLPPGPGRQRYRTVPLSSGTASATRTIAVLRSPRGAVDLTGIDPLYTGNPLVGTGTVQVSSGPDNFGSVQWALPVGSRTLAATIRRAGPSVDRPTLVHITTDRRTLLVATVAEGRDLPVSLDVRGAAWVRIAENPDPWAEWSDTHVQLLRPRVSDRPAPIRGVDPRLRYLTDLTPVVRAACVTEIGVGVANRSHPASIRWNGDPSVDCTGPREIEYRLGHRYARLRAVVGNPELGAMMTDLSGGVVTVQGDGVVLGSFAVTDSELPLDLDVRGVDRLRFVFSRNEGAYSGQAAVETPTLLLRPLWFIR